MRNTKGEGYITICILILVFAMLISVFVEFADAVNIVKQTKRNSRVVLDSFIMKNSTEIYDSVKNGNDYTDFIDADEYISEFSYFNSLDIQNEMLYCVDNDGNELYRISKPIMTFVNDNELKLQIEYTVIIPLHFAGIKVSEANIPIKVKSRFDSKF